MKRNLGSIAARIVPVVVIAIAGIAAISLEQATADDNISRGAPPPAIVPTTLDAFFMPGSQPREGEEFRDIFLSAEECRICHGRFANAGLNPDADIYDTWSGSMMAQAMRDPLFLAALTVANQDAEFSGDLCLRCHTPVGWLEGRSVPTDGSALKDTADFEGVTCHLCHRLVAPIFEVGVSPMEDFAILQDLVGDGTPVITNHNANMVVDPYDRRRGPFDDLPVPDIHGFDVIQSPFHVAADICATCHDVSNPVFEYDANTDSYVPTALDQPHPTQNKYDMFPVERTFSEWTQSQFNNGGVQLNGRFGGNHPTGVMETCQDCHMPDINSPGCIVFGHDARPNMPQHAFNGGNTWVLKAVRALNDDAVTGLTDDVVSDSMDRVYDLLQSASDLTLASDGANLTVRIINFTGHKLPSGYPEGRRMWLNVVFKDAMDTIVTEHGHYDFVTADLITGDTKVYETHLGLDATMAGITGMPAGESFHFALNNTILKDNRIPPMGFTNAAFEIVQAKPVAATYADGQYWDDTLYTIPAGATTATVTLYYQTSSKEYIEFLRDENITDNRGQVLHDQWVAQGKSEPFPMDLTVINLTGGIADLDADGTVNSADLAILLGSWGPCPPPPSFCAADLDADGQVGSADLAILLGAWAP